jgi:hypothetical protein
VLFLQEVNVAEGEMEFTIDLRPFMNPSPYTVQHVRTAESVLSQVTLSFVLCCAIENPPLLSALRAVNLSAIYGVRTLRCRES